MTKAEFAEQFKRLRVAGYRLPIFDGVTVKDVTDEWYATFGSCSVTELSHAIDRLKQTKTDTFWPASGELWEHIFQYRKERRIRSEINQSGPSWEMSEAEAQEFLRVFRAAKEKILRKMSMADAQSQVEPEESNGTE